MIEPESMELFLVIVASRFSYEIFQIRHQPNVLSSKKSSTILLEACVTSFAMKTRLTSSLFRRFLGSDYFELSLRPLLTTLSNVGMNKKKTEQREK
jgi:hypothetical protein